jgi:hypothetical protein
MELLNGGSRDRKVLSKHDFARRQVKNRTAANDRYCQHGTCRIEVVYDREVAMRPRHNEQAIVEKKSW